MPPQTGRSKPVSLLSAKPPVKTTPSVRQAKSVVAENQAVVTHASSASARIAKKLCCYLVVIVLAVTLYLFPKPVLVKYRVGGSTLQNVYWDGFEQRSYGRLLDADYVAYLSEGRQELTLCSRYQQNLTMSHGNCATYPYEKTQGTLFAVYHLLTSSGIY